MILPVLLFLVVYAFTPYQFKLLLLWLLALDLCQ
jgi:hypothetical protein